MLKHFRWHFFILSIFITAPIYHLYFFPILFKKIIEMQFLEIYSPSHLEFLFNSLFIFYVFPNIFLLIFKKTLFHALTLRGILFLSSSFIFFGQILFEVGFYGKSIHIMIFSRGLYGLGAETLFLMLNLLLLKYFSKEHLSLILAIIMTISNLFGAFSFLLNGYLFFYFDIDIIIGLNRVLVLISYFFAFLTVCYDLYLEKVVSPISILLENFKRHKKQDRILLADLYTESLTHHKGKELNYYLYLFAFFYIPNIICFNNFGSSFLLEKRYYNSPLKQGVFNVSIDFCVLWFFATFSSSLMSFYLERHTKREEYLIYFTTLAILGHFSLLFLSPIIGTLCLGVSFGCCYSIFMNLIQSDQQNEEHFMCVINLGIIIISYFVAFVGMDSPFYSQSENILIFCSFISFLISVKYFHDKQLKMQERNDNLEKASLVSCETQEKSLKYIEMKTLK